MILIAVRYDVNNFERSIVVQELELAMCTLCGLLLSLGHQYNVESLS